METAGAVLGSRADAATSERVIGLDLVRGVCALAVLVYHVLAWNGWAHLYTWGTYGVYIFFVLSGASMWVAYAPRFARGYSLAIFLALRLVRLLPLYLVALALVIVSSLLRGNLEADTAATALLNLSFQFGLGNPGATAQVVGGWSLGIEFVFYLLFPVALALMSGRWWWLMLLVAFASQHVFVNVTLAGRQLEQAFRDYTQFLAFAFYFAAGCAIGRAVLQGWIKPTWLAAPALIAAGCGVAAWSLPNAAAGLTGIAGLALSLLAALIVAAAAALRGGQVLEWISAKLGAASYGVYILHPFVSGFLQKRAAVADPLTLVALTAVICVSVAMLLERWYERPVQRFFKDRLRSS